MYNNLKNSNLKQLIFWCFLYLVIFSAPIKHFTTELVLNLYVYTRTLIINIFARSQHFFLRTLFAGVCCVDEYRTGKSHRLFVLITHIFLTFFQCLSLISIPVYSSGGRHIRTLRPISTTRPHKHIMI